MRKQHKKKKKVNKKLVKFAAKARFHKRAYGIVTIIILVAALFLFVGSYFKLFSYAYNNGSPGDVHLGEPPDSTKSHPAGERFSLTLFGNIPDPRVGQWPSNDLHVNLSFHSMSNIKYISFSCGSGGPCTSGTATPASSPWHHDFATCININPSNFNNPRVSLLNVTYESVQPNSYNVGIDVKWTSGTCASPGGYYTKTFSVGMLHGQCGFSGTDSPCSPGGYDPGPQGPVNPGGPGPGGPGGPGPGGPGPGESNNPGDGSGPTATPSPGGGGGGGGSSATTQGDSPSSLPSPTTQGDQEQAKVEPSPFFDGKLFVAGSSTVAGTGGKAVSIGGFKLGYGWLYLLGGLVVAGASGFFGWRWLQHRKARG